MLRDKKIFLFDIDGTLAVDSTLYDGTRELLQYIREIGGSVFYITNNSTKSQRDYVEKFRRWNLEVEEKQFVTASYATCLYLKENYGDRKIYVMGTPSFVKEVRSYGLRVTEHAEADAACVVVGFDQSLTYAKIQGACELLFDRNVDYIGTNPDLRCPTTFGYVPDCGGICEMLNCTVDREPLYIGKPNPQIVELCLVQCDGRKEDVLVVGDRLYTDIACGVNADVDTAVVYTGEATPESVKETRWKPTYEFETIMDLYKQFRQENEVED